MYMNIYNDFVITFSPLKELLEDVLFQVRSSCPEMLYKQGVLKKCAKFTGKNLCRSYLFNKLAGQPAISPENTVRHRCFSVTLAEFKCTYFADHK